MIKESLSQLFNLQGCVAVLMGKAMAQPGARVISLEAAQKAAEEIQTGGDAISVRCDVLDKSSIAFAAGAVLNEFGLVEILVNGVGGNW